MLDNSAEWWYTINIVEFDSVLWKADMTEKPLPLQSVHRALDILEALEHAEDGLGVTALARQLDLKVGTTHNILKVLRQRGYVDQLADSARYVLGLRLIILGGKGFKNAQILRLAEGPLKELNRVTGETVFFGVRRHTTIENLLVLDGTRDIMVRAGHKPGSRLHCTAMGKVLLAYLDEAEIDALLAEAGLQPMTDATVTDAQVLKEQLATVRRQGYALNRGEESDGVYGFAVPVFDYRDQVVAGICVGYPAERWQVLDEQALIARARSYASQISRGLGSSR